MGLSSRPQQARPMHTARKMWKSLVTSPTRSALPSSRAKLLVRFSTVLVERSSRRILSGSMPRAASSSRIQAASLRGSSAPWPPEATATVSGFRRR